MNTYARKAWHVIGYTWNGAAYCPDCAPNPETVNQHGDTPAPVFAVDEFYLIDPETGEHTPHTCDTCRNPIHQ
jgi:hypothetical protein